MGHLQSERARLLLSSLADAGVRDVVTCPGSRSTPFLAAAAAEDRLTLWDVVDERSAAFFALGQARVTGRPSLLLSTSGTAGANFLPAVVEAGMDHLPLLVLTADRPAELVDCGANQTIDQLKLFGGHARRFVDLGEGDAETGSLRALRRMAARAVFSTLHPEPGAVHLNARARKPLEPRDAETPEEESLASAVGDLLAGPIARPTAPCRLPPEEALDELADLCRKTRRGVIVAGPAHLGQAAAAATVEELARRTAFPVLADAASQLRFSGGAREAAYVDASGLILGHDESRPRQAPELVLQLGRAPTTAAWERWLAAHAGVAHWVVAAHGWHDPVSTATRLLPCDVGPTLDALVAHLEPRHRERPWTRAWRAAEGMAQDLVDDALAAADGLGEGLVVRRLVEALPPGALLAVGNSLPIRHLDLYGRASVELAVLAQRGASGIDGVTSGAFGAASKWERPAALLTGDLSFLHDVGGLAAARKVRVPFVLVVVQNRGGRIFEQLPIASHPAAGGAVFDHWTTPHDHDLEGAAKVFGLGFARATTGDELDRAVKRALGEPGVTVVEAVVPPHGAAEDARKLRRRLAAMPLFS